MKLVLLTIVSAAFIIVESFAAGTRLINSLPAYVLLGLAAFLAIALLRANKIQARPACLISSGIFFGYIVVRCLLSPVDYLSRMDLFMVLGSVAIYLLTALHLVKPRDRLLLIGLLLLIAVAQVCVGLIQFSKGNDFMLFGYGRSPNGSRASGQYISPNHLAGYLEVVSIMGASLVCWSTLKPALKILVAYATLVGFAGIIITGSRGGYVSSVFSILAFCALSFAVVKIAFPDRLLRIAGIAALLLLAISAAFPMIVTSRLVKNRASTIFTRDMRLHLWQAAISEIKLAPIFGTGSGTYLYYGRKFREPSVQADPVRVHNDYLDLIAEFGISGGIGFLLFLGTHLWNGFRSFHWLVTKRLQFAADWRSSSIALNIGALSAVAAYVAHSVVDFNMHIPANCMLMAFLFGILANPGLETFRPEGPTRTINRSFQFLLPALGLVIMIVCMARLPGEFYAEAARVALRDRKYYQAIEAAKRGIAWEKKNPDLFYYLGEARRASGDKLPPPLNAMFYSHASEAFTEGLALFPQDVRLLLIEAWTLDALGRFDKSSAYFEQAMEWDPKALQVQESYKGHLELLKNLGKTSGSL